MSAMLRLLAWILALTLVVLPVVAVGTGWIGGAQWPLRTLRLPGHLERVDEAQLRATVLPFAKRGFFAVELDRIQDAVIALPWVERAEVRKHWPDVLEVRISEHRPFARWGADRLLSEQGRLFPASNGSLYGRSPQGLTAGLKRPQARTTVPGLYLAGGGAHPGAGMPMAVLSARHAAGAIMTDLALRSTSRQTATPGGTLTGSAPTGRAPSR